MVFVAGFLTGAVDGLTSSFTGAGSVTNSIEGGGSGVGIATGAMLMALGCAGDV